MEGFRPLDPSRLISVTPLRVLSLTSGPEAVGFSNPPGEGERDLFRRIAMSQGDQLGQQWKIIQTFVSSGYLKHSAPPKADISAI